MIAGNRAVGLALAGALSSACAGTSARSGPFAPTEASDQVGEPAAYLVAPGEPFEIHLPANPSTGYAWELGAPLDGAVVRAVSTAYEPSPRDADGAAGSSVWTFAGVGAGRTIIVLVYRRPWEPEVAPARVAAYSVAVN